MPKPRSLVALFMSLVLLPWHQAAAQSTDRWFQVELLVFSHETTNTLERFEATPALVYPGAARFLVEPARVEDNLRQHPGDSVVDEFGRQVITLATEGEDGAQEPTVNDGATGDGPGQGAATSVPQEPLRPTPFIALPGAQLEFRGKAAYMQRLGRYRTLFHHAWVQPVGDRANALPLVLDRSGDTGDWPRLQGSVLLYLSRYLHIETNLWLNTAGNYLPGTWRMPEPPLGPPSLVLEEPTPPELDPAGGVFATSRPGFQEGEDLSQDPEEMEVAEPTYPWRHAVLLQQKRRMRSNEVHYLDHPLFGLVVKLTPLEEEELEALAREEAAAQAAQGQAL